MAAKVESDAGSHTHRPHFTALAQNSLDVFNKAVDAFNAQDPDELKKWLDLNVVVYGLHDGVAKYTGRHDVILYLTNDPGDSPISGIGGSKFHPDPVYQRVTDRKVKGSAAWHDVDNSPRTVLNYDFDFDATSGLIVKFYAD